MDKSIIESYPRYERYKDSGVDWLGKIPEQWNVERLGSLLKEVSEKNYPDLDLLSITREKGVIKRDVSDMDSNQNFIPDDLSGYKKLEAGQFGMNKMKAWQGSYGISPYTGIVSPAYYVFDIHPELDKEFFSLAIRSRLYVNYFGSASDGVRIGQWDLNKTRMRQMRFVIPIAAEQKKIVSFISDKANKIEKAIELKQKQIEKLEEYKQIVIQNAVTKGLDPDVPMKDSGVNWIGEIPEHWRIDKGLSVLTERKLSNKGMVNDTVLSLSYGQIIIKSEDKMYGLMPESFETYQIVKPNDIIIRCTDLQNDKVSLRTSISKVEGIITSAYLNLMVNKQHSPDYIQKYLHTLDTNKALYKFGRGLRQNLSYRDFRSMPMVLPPLKEQLEIVNYINDISETISKTTLMFKSQIKYLEEYKTVLINDAVTGKIKVA